MKRTFATALAFLMLISNIGFSMNTHYCGGKAVKSSFSLGLHNPDCGMAKMEQGCEDVPVNEDQVTKKPCCDNKHQILQVDENIKIQSSKISPVFFIAFVHTFLQRLWIVNQTLVHNQDYVPPIPDKDIQVLFQTFLI